MKQEDLNELAKAAIEADGPDLVKALYAGAEAEAIAHRMLTDSRYGPTYESMKPEHSKMWKAADLILSLISRVENAEARVLELEEHLLAETGHASIRNLIPGDKP